MSEKKRTTAFDGTLCDCYHCRPLKLAEAKRIRDMRQREIDDEDAGEPNQEEDMANADYRYDGRAAVGGQL